MIVMTAIAATCFIQMTTRKRRSIVDSESRIKVGRQQNVHTDHKDRWLRATLKSHKVHLDMTQNKLTEIKVALTRSLSI